MKGESMSDEEEVSEEPEKKGGSLILPAVAAASLLGAVAFGLVLSGTVLGPAAEEIAEAPVEDEVVDETVSVQFVKLDPLMVSLGGVAAGQNLRFEGYLEVPNGQIEQVQQLMPRVMDVLNTYLRAVDYADINEASALLKLRLQMLKRVQFVVGEDAVTDLLVSKFLVT